MRHSSLFEVSLGALSRNFARIQQLAPRAKILPMVKGDAYGHGLVRVGRHLVEELNVTRFGVASLHEAVALLNGVPRMQKSPKYEVVVFSDTEINNAACRVIYNQTAGGCAAAVDTSVKERVESDDVVTFLNESGDPHNIEARVIPVIGTPNDLELFLGVSADATSDTRQCFGRLPLFIKVNTGMNRMGITPDALNEFIPAIKEFRGGKVDMLMQHFGSSWIPHVEGDATGLQYASFRSTVANLNGAGVRVLETSVSNSGAIEQGIGVDETWVRPGLMLYGPPSVVHEDTSVKDLQDPARYSPIYRGEVAGSLLTKINNVFAINQRDIEQAEGGKVNVGYGFNAVRGPCVIAIMPIGYADGFLRYNTGLRITIVCKEVPRGGSSDVTLTGEVHGLVNMDLTQLAFYPSEHGNPASLQTLQELLRQEQPVVVWDHDDNRDIHAKATFLSTNAYQLMTAVSVRVPRRYVP